MKNKIKRFLALVISLSLVLTMLTGCGGGADPSQADNGNSGGGVKVSDGPRDDINLQLYVEPVTLDPQISNSALDMGIMYQIFDNLFEINNGDYNDIIPALCERYDISDDAKEYTFYIRQGVKWHNGEELTADDVEFSINRMMTSPATSARMDFVDSVEKIDDYTVKCYLNLPSKRLPALLSTAAMSIVNKKAVEEFGDGTEQMVIGTGAYKLDSWTPGQGLVLKAFDEGWRGDPPIKKINYTIITEATAARIAFQGGELDIYNANGMHDYELFSKDPNLNVQPFVQATAQSLVFNSSRSIMSDIRFREAVAHAIDKEALNASATDNLYKVTDSQIPEGCQGYTEDVPKYEYDPEKSKELLKEMGYNGEPVKLLYTTAGISLSWATTVQAFLSSVGINVEMEGQDYANVVQRVANRDYDMCLFEFGMNFPNPVSSFYALFHSEGYYNVYCNYDKDVDAKIIKAYSSADEAEQTKLLEELNIEALEKCLYVPSYNVAGYTFAPKTLHRDSDPEPAFNWVKICYYSWEQ